MSNSEPNQEYYAMHKEIAKKILEHAGQVEFSNLELIEGVLQGHINSRRPLASAIDVPVDMQQYRLFLKEIAGIIAKHQPQQEMTVEAILSALDTTTEFETLVEATKQFNQFFFEDFSKRNELNGSILQFLMEMAYRPYLKQFAKIVNPKINLKNYHDGACPVCGEQVRIVRGAEDGKREGCCTRCSTIWEINRLQCPHCKNNDHKKLKYLTIGEDENKKLYVCEVCKGYVKYVEMKDMLDKPDFFLIDLETLYLDMVAIQEGYGGDGQTDNTNTVV